MAGWCAAENGDLERGIALATQAIAALQAMQSRHFLVYLLGFLADVHLKAGHHAEAMKAVEEGIALAEATGERYYDAELHRLRGELLARPRMATRAVQKPRFAPPSRLHGNKEPRLSSARPR